MLDNKFWEKYFKIYDVLNLLIPYQELLNDICDELDVKRGELILEAGCGTGNLALKIQERGGILVGLDNCQEALNMYKKKAPNTELILADLTKKLPFSDNYFDKVTSNNTLYTISEPEQLATLKEFYRILKPGGMVVISNLREGWDPFKIYSDGVKKEFKQSFLKAIIKLSRMIIPTIKILRYNRLIQKESKYYFCSLDEQKELLRKSGFSKILPSKKTYSDQAVMNSAYKL